jgi:hypothetical protein
MKASAPLYMKVILGHLSLVDAAVVYPLSISNAKEIIWYN